MNQEAGYQPELLRGGLHFMMPLKYKIHILPLVTITQGKSVTCSRVTARHCPPPRH